MAWVYNIRKKWLNSVFQENESAHLSVNNYMDNYIPETSLSLWTCLWYLSWVLPRKMYHDLPSFHAWLVPWAPPHTHSKPRWSQARLWSVCHGRFPLWSWEQRWFTTVILGASWIETSDSLLTSLIMKREREAILLWSLLILTSFIFALQDFLFLRHSGKLLDNTGGCQCKPPSCLLILDRSTLKYSPKHLLRARGQVSTHPPRTAWWVTAPGEEVGRGDSSWASGSHLGSSLVSQVKNLWHEKPKIPSWKNLQTALTKPA